jgi:hypothetical protein
MHNLYKVAVKAAHENNVFGVQVCLAGHTLGKMLGTSDTLLASLSPEELGLWNRVIVWAMVENTKPQEPMSLPESLSMTKEEFFRAVKNRGVNSITKDSLSTAVDTYTETMIASRNIAVILAMIGGYDHPVDTGADLANVLGTTDLTDVCTRFKKMTGVADNGAFDLYFQVMTQYIELMAESQNGHVPVIACLEGMSAQEAIDFGMTAVNQQAAEVVKTMTQLPINHVEEELDLDAMIKELFTCIGGDKNDAAKMIVSAVFDFLNNNKKL